MLNWIQGFVMVAEGIVWILSLGFYRPDWVFQYVLWKHKRELAKDSTHA